jgi:hypothetical protein
LICYTILSELSFTGTAVCPVIGDRIGHIATGAKALIFVAEHSCGFENPLPRTEGTGQYPGLTSPCVGTRKETANRTRPVGPVAKLQPSPEGLGHRFRNIVRAPEARHPECWSCRASSAPQSWPSVPQPGRVCVRAGRETAGPSTTLRSGRDDNSAVPARVSVRSTWPCNRIVIPTGAYPDFLPRSAGHGRVCGFP